jgi:hypothetical protein
MAGCCARAASGQAAAAPRDELAPSHIGSQAQRPALYRLKRVH